MSHQVIVIETPGSYLRLDQNRMVIDSPTSGHVLRPLDDIGMVILHTQQATVTTGLMAALSEVNATMVVCNDRHEPATVLLPFAGHSQTPQVLRAQMELSEPRKKQLWAQLVRDKIINQAKNVAHDLKLAGILNHIAASVKSGDRTNCEATAARHYWQAIFRETDRKFRRGSDHPLNALLNYCYAIVRSAIARAVVATGLHPTLGVFHSSRENSFALCDDLIEPFRPLADLWVRRICTKTGYVPALAPDIKRDLVAIMVSRLKTKNGEEEAFLLAIDRLAQSFKHAIDAPKARLITPESCEFLDID